MIGIRKSQLATEAAAEFQNFLYQPGVVLADPVGVMARLELARIFALSGNKSKVEAAYQDVLKIWKDADPALPVIKQARAEYAKLRQEKQ